MLKDYVKAIEAAGLELHSVSVMTSGKLAAEHYWLGDRDTRHILHSATKGVADGIKAQLIIVWPEKDTVIATTGAVSVERCEAQIVMDLAWEHLDPERL